MRYALMAKESRQTPNCFDQLTILNLRCNIKKKYILLMAEFSKKHQFQKKKETK
jgi:hypothetical protein